MPGTDNNSMDQQPRKAAGSDSQILSPIRSIYRRATDTPQDKDKQARSLTRAYVGAFSIIAVLSIISHLLTMHIINNQLASAKVTFAITGMRSMVDSVVSQAASFRASGDSFDDDLLTSYLDKLREKNRSIATFNDPAIEAIFNAPTYAINEKVQKLIGKADELMRNQRTNKREEAAKNFTELSTENARALEINLDLALDQYHDNIMRQIDIAYHLQYAGVIIILLVLILEATFIFRPLTRQLADYHGYLIRLALTDALTNLNNRRAFMQLANQGIDRYKRTHTPFCLVLMDLDHFKSVNDTYGHKVGDLVLQHYSKLMQKTLRSHDTLGRIGGEEFAIFLPQTTAEEAMPILERFRKAVAETPCPYTDTAGVKKELNYTSSFGMVSVTQGAWSLDELFVKADQNLYKAKEGGRNCIVMEKV